MQSVDKWRRQDRDTSTIDIFRPKSLDKEKRKKVVVSNASRSASWCIFIDLIPVHTLPTSSDYSPLLYEFHDRTDPDPYKEELQVATPKAKIKKNLTLSSLNVYILCYSLFLSFCLFFFYSVLSRENGVIYGFKAKSA